MLSAWLPKVLLFVMVALVLTLFRSMAPPRARVVSHRYDESQIPERLPSGLHLAKDVIIDFADGRRLRANQVGEGGTNIRNDVMQLLIAKTALTPEHASTSDEVPPFRAAR
jgi:hypothetical protein